MKYFVITLGVLALLSIYPIYSLTYHAPSCTDGIQNQDETGIDCGGNMCPYLCTDQELPLAIKWTHVFPQGGNVYDIAADLINRNDTAGIPLLSYTVTVTDASGATLYTKQDQTYVNPGEEFPIFIPEVTISGNPQNITISFDPSMHWVRGTRQDTGLSVKNLSLTSANSSPRLDATIQNDSFTPKNNITAYAMIYDTSGNIRAISSTAVSSVDAQSSQPIFFTWNSPITSRPANAVCAAPVDAMLVFDRSGSMTNDGKNPPQPITTAKDAAQSFVDNMQSTDHIGLESFATTATLDQGLTADRTAIGNAIQGISIHTDGTQYTDLGDAIAQATQELVSNDHQSNAKQAMVIMTDGIASRPLDPSNPNNDAYAATYAAQMAAAAKKDSIIIYVIGLGKDVNASYLSGQIATDPQHYFEAPTKDQLTGVYDKIAQTVCAEENFVKVIDIRAGSFQK